MLTENQSDLRAEFVAGSWLDEGIVEDKILFRPLGSFKRRSHTDVESVGEAELGNFEGKIIASNRNGIYDHLPEQLFHLPSAGSINTLKKKVDEIRLQREKEQKSRLFFLPLEHEFFLNRVKLARLEQLAHDLNPDSLLLDELRNFWQVPANINKAMLVRLVPVMPLISENRGDLKVAGEILSAVLEYEVTFQALPAAWFTAPSETRLNNALLGLDLILGGEIEVYSPRLVAEIQLPNSQVLEKCLQDQEFSMLVTWLSGWFVPVECDLEIALRLPPGASPLLFAENELQQSRLGYSTI
ncbi:type VI secretion system baseplate subunit TssG [Dyadobacter aurulentus]|uniref:type VI secretion system baseplate subunit TssG n=1 Tax=Dyadobacter sp. UC 10 TaxID=2605428 RepID=UPI0011F39219|nr:type VI secretion system baseplate subunit TssG [Dyadobacter sp. UC 10]KAA0990286.1 hypothetical protein FXO21_09020 [Dyadobacter sp. UC 10]